MVQTCLSISGQRLRPFNGVNGIAYIVGAVCIIAQQEYLFRIHILKAVQTIDHLNIILPEHIQDIRRITVAVLEPP